MEAKKVLTVFVSLVICQVTAMKCFDCTGVDSVHNCSNSMDCQADEHCHARQYINGAGNFVFDLNCKPITIEKRGKTEPSDGLEIEIWTSCCDHDFCNIHFDKDGTFIDVSKQVMECYNCQGIDDPADCTTTTTCKVGEACITHEKISGNKKIFDMGCLPKVVCGGIGYHLELSKRKRHTKRFELCRGCCDRNDKCNNQFCSKKLGLTDMTALGTQIAVATTKAPPPSVSTTTTPRPVITVDYLRDYHLIVTPANQTGAIGSTVVFDCEFDKSINESMTLTWFFKDKQGISKRIYSGISSPPSLDFYVKFLDVKDEGEYTCEAEYNGHIWSAKAILNVPGSLQITRGPDTLSVAKGQSATFSCEADGFPKPTITWELLHNSPVPKPVTLGVTDLPQGSQLHIDHVGDGDAGVYKCVATSPFGSKSALAVLTVT